MQGASNTAKKGGIQEHSEAGTTDTPMTFRSSAEQG
jgi:hypothetical protein